MTDIITHSIEQRKPENLVNGLTVYLTSNKDYVGRLILQEWEDPKIIGIKGNVIHVNELIISPKFRGKNYSKLLVNQLIKYSQERNLPIILSFAGEWDVKRGEKYFKKFGFKKHELGFLYRLVQK